MGANRIIEPCRSEIILVREAKLVRVVKDLGLNSIYPGPNGMGAVRREGRLPYYKGRNCTGRFKPVFYDLLFLEYLWRVRLDQGKIYHEYFIVTSDPGGEGFVYHKNINPLPKGLEDFTRPELSDIVRQSR